MKMGKSLRNTLTGAFSLIASTAAAEIDMADWETEQYGDVDISVLADREDNKANMFSVICPYSEEFGDLSGRSAASVFLYSANPESIREQIKTLDDKIPAGQIYRAETMPLPQVNIGVINKDASLTLSYSYGGIKNILRQAMETQDGFEGSSIDNADMRKRLITHSSAFCFNGS